MQVHQSANTTSSRALLPIFAPWQANIPRLHALKLKGSVIVPQTNDRVRPFDLSHQDQLPK
jgi:hypothetical protein